MRGCSLCRRPGHNSRTCPLNPKAVPFNQAEYARKHRERAVADGKCGACATRPATPGTKRCEECRHYQNDYGASKRGVTDPTLRKCGGGCGALIPKDGPRKCSECFRTRRGWNSALPFRRLTKSSRPEDRMSMTAEDFEEFFR